MSFGVSEAFEKLAPAAKTSTVQAAVTALAPFMTQFESRSVLSISLSDLDTGELRWTFERGTLVPAKPSEFE